MSEQAWDDFPGPRHQAEVDTGHEGQPSVEEQNLTHGAPRPPEDRGADDDSWQC